MNVLCTQCCLTVCRLEVVGWRMMLGSLFYKTDGLRRMEVKILFYFWDRFVVYTQKMYTAPEFS